MQNSLLVISAMGQDRPGIVEDLSRQILECNCNVEDSRMTVLGCEFALILLISGRWDAVAKLENSLDATSKKLELTISHRRTEARKPTGDSAPYAVDVSSMDQQGIVHSLANFFASRKFNIEDLATASYSAPHTGTPMFSVQMTIGVPSSFRIATLREEFYEYCESMNVDGVLEPVKS